MGAIRSLLEHIYFLLVIKTFHFYRHVATFIFCFLEIENYFFFLAGISLLSNFVVDLGHVVYVTWLSAYLLFGQVRFWKGYDVPELPIICLLILRISFPKEISLFLGLVRVPDLLYGLSYTKIDNF